MKSIAKSQDSPYCEVVGRPKSWLSIAAKGTMLVGCGALISSASVEETS